MITHFLASLGRRAPLILALGIFIGLALPDLAAFVRPLLTPSVFCMLVITMLRIDWPTVGTHMRSPARLTLSLGWVMILCPTVMALLVAPLDLPSGLKIAMVLYAAAPPLLTAPALALFAGLDGALALIVVVVAMFIYPVLLPPLAFTLLGIDLAVGAIDLMLRLALLIGGAFGLAMLIRLRAGLARIAELKHHLDGGLVMLMIVFAIATMDGIAARAMAEPAFVATFVAAVFAVNIGLQGFTMVGFWRLEAIPRTTLGLVAGNRNLALLTAALGSAVDPDLFLYFAIGQLPIYLLPMLLLPAYRWLTRQRTAASQKKKII